MLRTPHLPPHQGAWSDPANAEAWHALRARYLTSTDIPALMGVSRYCSKKKLFKLKLDGRVNEVRDTEQMQFGRQQEASIALAVTKLCGLKTEPMREFITLDDPRMPEIGMASTYDWCVLEKFGSSPWGKTPLEIKTCNPFAIWKGYWRAQGSNVAYAGKYVEFQMQAQMIVGGFLWERLGVGVGTPEDGVNRHLVGYRTAHPLTQDSIWAAVVEFNKEIGAARRARIRGFLSSVPSLETA